MKALMILLLAWPSLALSISSWEIPWIGPVRTFPGDLVEVIDDRTIVTIADDLKTLKYWDLELGLVDTLDLGFAIDWAFKEDDFRTKHLLSPDQTLFAYILDGGTRWFVCGFDTVEDIERIRVYYIRLRGRDSQGRFSGEGIEMAVSNADGRNILWDVETVKGLPSQLPTNPGPFICLSKATSPDSSTYATVSSRGVTLSDRDDRWKINLNFPGERESLGHIAYLYDGLFLAASHGLDTHVWDLSRFPPHTPPIGELVVVDSLGNLIDSSNTSGFDVWIDDVLYIEGNLDESGRMPLMLCQDGYYSFYLLRPLWHGRVYAANHWSHIPLRHDAPFTLTLVCKEPFKAWETTGERVVEDPVIPWEITGQRVSRADVELTFIDPKFFLFRLLGLGTPREVRIFRSNSAGKRTLLATDTITEDENDIEKAFELRQSIPPYSLHLTIADFESVNGLYEVESDSPSGELFWKWHSIPINEGRRNSFVLSYDPNHYVGYRKPVAAGDDTASVSASPNPFNSTVSIRFHLPEEQEVRLTVYNMAGQLVKILESNRLPSGWHERSWHGDDLRGREVASGIYPYRLKTAGRVHDGKIVLVR